MTRHMDQPANARICPVCGNPFMHGDSRREVCSKKCVGLRRSRLAHPNLREDFFATVDTREKAYWLGFLYADGCVRVPDSKGTGKHLLLSQTVKDRDQVERFCAAVGASPDGIRIRRYSDGSNRQPAARLRIGNQVFVEHLIAQGLTPRKSLTVRLPSLPDDTLALALLLGYFDGNGCASNKAVLTSGSFAFLDDVKERFGVPREVRGSDHDYDLTIGMDLYSRMLDAYPDSMPRKRSIHHSPSYEGGPR